jgi:hypothetical protein
MPMMIQNFVLFQIGWFCCVLSGANQFHPLTGVIIVSIIVMMHLQRANNSISEIMLILFAMIIGTLWDSSLMRAGLFQFSTTSLISGLAPLWLIAMWALFATTLNVSLKWLKGRYWLAAILGATGGPLAYYAGHQLGAVAFSDTTSALLATAAGWAIIMPALVALTVRYDGFRNSSQKLSKAEAL